MYALCTCFHVRRCAMPSLLVSICHVQLFRLEHVSNLVWRDMLQNAIRNTSYEFYNEL